ncbi:MAG TPA: VCBS repeat-containing protein, partial [Candidatus Binatia bacterium]|nr:VCBS repeat-containing protein [Candidatus Binatia bacterium]
MNSWLAQPRRFLLAGTAGLGLLTAVVHGQSLQWIQREGYREAELSVPTTGRTGFTLLPAAQTGILFTNTLSYARAEANQNLMNGAGVAAGDFDGDGLCDLYFANAEGSNGLFRNTGYWRFENATASAGVACGNMSS